MTVGGLTNQMNRPQNQGSTPFQLSINLNIQVNNSQFKIYHQRWRKHRAIYAVYTVVDTVDMVYTVDTNDMVCTVDMAYTVDMVYTALMIWFTLLALFTPLLRYTAY